jgi:uncharacterized protein YihD (DUF1040 family)
MLPDHRRELEAVEIRHAHVDQNQRDLILEQALERLARRAGLEEPLADLRKHDLVAQQLCFAVVNEEDVDLVGPVDGFAAHGGLHRCSHMRSAESSCSTLTGFAR